MFNDFDAVGRIIRDVAEREVMPRFGNLGPSDIAQKTHKNDLVTTADTESERALSEALVKLCPDSVIVGEEGASADARILARLQEQRLVWLLDPVDGTHNFAKSKEYFAVIVALCAPEGILAGWILDPISNRLIWAGKGKGAWIDDGVSQTRLKLESAKSLERLRGSIDYRSAKRIKTEREAGLSPLPHTVARQGCTGREYMELAQGVLDFAQYRRLKPWDHAAGVLIHGEAGGFARLREGGGMYRPASGIVEDTILLAPDGHTWTALAAILR